MPTASEIEAEGRRLLNKAATDNLAMKGACASTPNTLAELNEMLVPRLERFVPLRRDTNYCLPSAKGALRRFVFKAGASIVTLYLIADETEDDVIEDSKQIEMGLSRGVHKGAVGAVVTVENHGGKWWVV